MNELNSLLDRIIALAAEALQTSPAEIAIQVNVQELGFDSVSLVRFVDSVSAWLDEDVHPGLFFEHSTLEAFAGYLMAHKADSVQRALAGAGHTGGGMAAKPAAVTSKDADPWQAMAGELGAAKTMAKPAAERPAAVANGVSELPQDLPVIVGGGIGGMLISRALCRKGIRHLLIGSPQIDDSPKLGESMTEACTIEFSQDFPGYEPYLFRKEFTPFFMGDIVAGLRFDFFGTMASLFLDRDIPKAFIHVDRIGFDRKLHEEVSASPHCVWVDSLVGGIEHDTASDRVTLIRLKDGRTTRPTYAWDCTNHVRLFGRTLNIPYKDFDAPRQVIFSHYYQKDCKDLCHRPDLPWMHATTLLRADTAHDGLEGVSWFIPLGSYVSVGVSMLPSDMGDRNPEEILSALTRAYQRRGLDYTRDFSRRKEVVSVPSQHFMYDRFYGGNWAMVGGCAASTWFTSGSQISMLACMAAMADRILEQPQVYGEHYSRHVRGFARTQQVYDTLLGSDIGPLDAMKFLSSIVEQARRRISSYYMFRKGIDTPTARVAEAMWNEETLVDRKYFEFLRQIATHAAPANRRDQAAAIFERLNVLRAEAQKVRIPYLRDNAVRQERSELFL